MEAGRTSLTKSLFFVLRYIWDTLLFAVFYWQGGPRIQTSNNTETSQEPPRSGDISLNTENEPLIDNQEMSKKREKFSYETSDYDLENRIDLRVEFDPHSAPSANEQEFEQLNTKIADINVQFEVLSKRPDSDKTPTPTLKLKLKNVIGQINSVLTEIDNRPSASSPSIASPISRSSLKRVSFEAEREDLDKKRDQLEQRLNARAKLERSRSGDDGRSISIITKSNEKKRDGSPSDLDEDEEQWARVRFGKNYDKVMKKAGPKGSGNLSGRKRNQKEMMSAFTLFQDGDEPKSKKPRSISKKDQRLFIDTSSKELDSEKESSEVGASDSEEAEKKRKKDISSLTSFGESDSDQEADESPLKLHNIGVKDLLANLDALEDSDEKDNESNDDEDIVAGTPPSLDFDAGTLLDNLNKLDNFDSDKGEDDEIEDEESSEPEIIFATKDAKTATKDLLASLDRFKQTPPSKKNKMLENLLEGDNEEDGERIEASRKGRKSSKGSKAANAFDLFRQQEKIEEKSDSWESDEEAAEPQEHDETSNTHLLSSVHVAEDLNKAGMRRGKKGKNVKLGPKSSAKYEMEDTHIVLFPFDLKGVSESALLCVFDGHAGKGCATALKEIIPRLVAENWKPLSNNQQTAENEIKKLWDSVYTQADEELKEFEYEGSTSTTVLIWKTEDGGRFLSCANVGDSTAFLVRKGEALQLSEDHKPTLKSERKRIEEMGIHLEEGQSRLNGLAVSRAFGNHFPKEMQCGMIVNPHISPLFKIGNDDLFVFVASDGLWDAVSGQYAYDLVKSSPNSNVAAKKLLKTALDSSKCHDNVTVIVAALK